MSSLKHDTPATQSHGAAVFAAAPRVSTPLPRPVRIFWAINFTLGAISFLTYIIAQRYNYPYPCNFPFLPFKQWIDFRLFRAAFQHFHQLDFFTNAPRVGDPFMYPAPVAMLYQAFYLIGPHGLLAFAVVTGSLTALLTLVLGRAMVRAGARPLVTAIFLIATILASYPLWFEFTLGNMEICVFLIVSFALIAFLNDRLYLAAGLIGLAISLKIFPFVYLALFFSRRQYRQLVYAIGVAFVSNLVSLWLLCPSLAVSYRGVEWGLNQFRHRYMLRYLLWETGFDHSLFAFIKQASHHSLMTFYLPDWSLTLYLALATIGGLALYFLWIRRLPLLNQILSLSILSILLPPTSHDYTLLYLYLPWALLVLFALRNAGDAQLLRSLIPAFVCLALLVSSESEIIHHGRGLSGQLKAILLVVLLVISLRQRWPTPTPSKMAS